MKREILVPSPVILTQLDGSLLCDPNGAPLSPVPFASFVADRTADDAFVGVGKVRDMADIVDQVEVIRLARDLKQGDRLVIEEALWARLDRATRNPSGGYTGIVARCLLPHMLAITNARVYEPPAVAPVADAAEQKVA